MSKQKSQSIEFSCHAPDAGTVFLAGSFNDWQTDVMPMTKDGRGKWNANLDLPAGCHEFKFVVDGQWCCEPNCQTSNPIQLPGCVSRWRLLA